MYLKCLEISGFKSFAQPVKIEFEPGMTAIVGPNGCGKSNIVDAISWCWGEKSGRALRSAQQLDLIFNGTAKRPAGGMAEVSLVFAEVQNVLPVDTPEVVVTRRIFRSGESEYLLNRQTCRLKDIRELFLDTGLGSQGYAVIEQGKVEFLLSARPEERRELFEEAAGISKYKLRREETLKKIEKVELDLLRLQDSLTLLHSQVKSLDSAARKARQYQRYQEELKNLEIASRAQTIKGLEDDRKKREGEREECLAIFAQQSNEYHTLEAALNQQRLDLDKEEEILLAKQKQRFHLEAELAGIQRQVELAGEREREFGERVAQLATEIERFSTQRQVKKNDWQKLEEEKNNFQTVIRELEKEVAQSEISLQEQSVKLSQISERVEDYQNQLFTRGDELAKINNELNVQREERLNYIGEISILSQELEKVRLRYQECEQELSALGENINQQEKGLEQSIKREAGITTAREELQAKINSNQTEVLNLEKEISGLRGRREFLEQQLLEDPYFRGSQEILTQRFPGLRGPLYRLYTVSEEKQAQLAEVLGGFLNCFVCEDLATAESVIKFLEEKKAGKVRILVRQLLPPELLSGGELPDFLPVAQEDEWVFRYLWGDVRFKEGRIYHQGIVQGGYWPGAFPSGLNYSWEREKILTAETDKQKRFNQVQEALAQWTVRLENSAKELMTIRQQREELQGQLIREKERYEQRRISRDLLTREMSFLEQERTNRQESCTQLQGREENLQLRINEMRKAEDSLRQQLPELLAEKEKQAGVCRQAEQQIQKLQWQFSQQQTRLSTLKEEYQTKSAELDFLEEQIQARSKEQESLKQRIGDCIEQRQRDAESVLRYQNDLQGLLKTIHQQESRCQTFRDDIKGKEKEVHNRQLIIEEKRQILQRSELAVKEVSVQLEELHRELKDYWGVKFSELAGEIFTLTVDTAAIEHLRKKVTALGAVNLAAPEEYSALEERYNFLKLQQEDLLRAKEDLLKAIQQINQTTQENFLQVFSVIRKNFQELYGQLFTGGQADVVLTNAENILEAGVEIVAQPPGKHLQNISLLSGGEKALTVIALLFSFFLAHPSPMCILDEVDAPLDDANVKRFIKLLQNLARETQFLVITHNKLTMSAASVLWGITMEEPGVSKIVTVRLSDDKKTVTAAEPSLVAVSS